MRRKTKPIILLPSERHFWQRINQRLITSYLLPVIFLFIAGVSIVLAQWSVLSRSGESFSVGKPAPETYRVISRMRYDDQDAAESLRTMVSDSVVGVTVRDVSAKSRLQRRLEALRNINDPSSKPYLAYLPEAFIKAFDGLNTADKARILNLSYQIGSAYIDRLESEKVFRNNTTLMSSLLWEEIHKAQPQGSDANFIYQILAGVGNLNFRTDEALTELARQAAVNDVPTIDRKLEPGDVIVTKGDVITEQIAALLRLQGYTEDVFPLAQLCVVFVLVLAFPLWLDILGHGAGDNMPTWWCVVFIMVTAWVCEAFAAYLNVRAAGVVAAVSVSYLCVHGYMAFCLAIIASSSGVFVIAGQAVSNMMMLAAMAVFTSTVGFYVLRHLEFRRQVTYRISLLALMATAARMTVRWILGAPLIQDNFRLFIPLGEFWQEAGVYFVYEVFITHVTLIILQYFEESLGTLSILSLREISHPSSPLLRDLQRHAPGTYQHCLTIATLIEAVGFELGMDVNLLRAGAYYHDIGKLRKPSYFVENQGGGHNVHDEMSPMLSSITIISHVKDGLELAWENKLPKRIRDFIAEHHGTTCTFYFYKKALAQGENVERASFCYPGPRPQSRETALLMIVDSVEAAVRAANIRELAAEDTNRGKGQAVTTIEKIVNQVVASKIAENQFDDVNFTQKDLARIKQTLISVLISMYHTRKVKKIESSKS
ncbi:MAG: HDIG domain-containing protein [Synergistaceae bacterium]|nr:HDIG domain-containing protein [Synergistaceae bacterium]